MKEKEQRMISKYDQLYSLKNNKSFREEWEGKISLEYKIPKYATLFVNCFEKDKNLTFLELGAGDGMITKSIIKKMKTRNYVATEISKEGIAKLRGIKGIRILQMDAENLLFEDNSFDIVCCFDVIHHVKNPRKMAEEMLRVAKKYIFLIEPNGLCLIRRILEKTKKYKTTNEKSYLPYRYKSFFNSKNLKIMIKPFLFMIPFTPKILTKFIISLSEFLEKVPLIRWQGSSLLIIGKKGIEDRK